MQYNILRSRLHKQNSRLYMLNNINKVIDLESYKLAKEISVQDLLKYLVDLEIRINDNTDVLNQEVENEIRLHTIYTNIEHVEGG